VIGSVDKKNFLGIIKQAAIVQFIAQIIHNDVTGDSPHGGFF
jgi:hypothetical protein